MGLFVFLQQNELTHAQEKMTHGDSETNVLPASKSHQHQEEFVRHHFSKQTFSHLIFNLCMMSSK